MGNASIERYTSGNTECLNPIQSIKGKKQCTKSQGKQTSRQVDRNIRKGKFTAEDILLGPATRQVDNEFHSVITS